MIDKRETLILYTTATCNLNCKYCFIDKNPSLLKIDEILDNSFKDDYYFNLTKKMFLQDKLSEIQFWGGEPFLNLKRAYDTVDKCIQYFPKLSKFMASTNFVSEPFFGQFFGFIELKGVSAFLLINL
jgi:sulfatase maturation enzyme AslB (radical SAM superfamily)